MQTPLQLFSEDVYLYANSLVHKAIDKLHAHEMKSTNTYLCEFSIDTSLYKYKAQIHNLMYPRGADFQLSHWSLRF